MESSNYTPMLPGTLPGPLNSPASRGAAHIRSFPAGVELLASRCDQAFLQPFLKME